jgi:excisionase family DNA binding protein
MLGNPVTHNQTITSARLLKAQDVAAILNVSRSFAYALMQSGQLPSVRLGRSIRVRPSDLEEYISRSLAQNPD